MEEDIKNNYSKNLEEALKESEERFKSLFYNHPEALVYIDKNGNVIDINPKFTDLFGYTLDEIKGRNINEGFIHPDNLKEEGRRIDEIALKTGYINFETVRKRKDGTLIPVSISGAPIIINGEIYGVVGLYIDLTEKKKQEEALKHLSTHDPLTGLSNKILLEEKFKMEKARYERYKSKFAIFYIDLYEFKFINDNFGHNIGDEVLKIISNKLLNNIRKCDLISRVGGDEFILLLTDIESPEKVRCVANKIIKIFEEPIKFNEHNFEIGVNIGISMFPDDGENLEDLIKKADFAMYYAKSVGKNIFSFFNHNILNERRESFNIIRRSEYKLESIFNCSPFGMILLDDNKNITYVNKKALEILNLNREEIFGKNFDEIFCNSNLIKNKDYFENIFIKEINELQMELPFIKKSGEKIFLRLNLYHLEDINLNISYYLIFLYEITKEMLLSYDLRKEKEFLKNVLDNLEVIVVLEDLKGNIQMINRYGCEILGYSEEEIVGKNWIESFTPDYYKEEMKKFYSEINKGEIEKYYFHENPIITKSGEERIILWKNSYLNDDDGNIVGLLSSGIDITENLKLRKILREKEEVLKKVFDATDEIIFIKDLDGVYINANLAFSKIFERPLEEIVGKKDEDLFTKEEAEYLRNIDKRIIETKKTETFEDRLIINGEEFIFRTTKAPIVDENGVVCGICGFADNITELKKREEEREELIEILKQELNFQQSLRKISDYLSSYKNLKSLLRAVLEEVDKIVPSSSSNIALIQNGNLINVAARGYEKYGVSEFVDNFVMNIKDFPIEDEVVLEKKPLIINDTYKDKRWIVIKETSFIKSHLMIPIILRGEVIGLLRLDSDKENSFTKVDAEKLMLFSNSIGVAIDNIKHIERLKSVTEQIIVLVTKLSEIKDPFTSGHQKRVSEIAVKIAHKMNLTEDKVESIRFASLLHDIGKLAIPGELLTKPGKLTPIEFEIIKDHVRIGYELLKDVDFPYPIQQIILQHHERLNGSGYPNGLKNGEIMLESRILSVADVIEAMTSHRPYRPAYTIKDAIDELLKNKGILYDEDVVDAYVELFNENDLC